MNEPVLSTFAHPWLGQLSLVLSTYMLEVPGKASKRIPYLWIGREDGETIATLSVILKDREKHLYLPPNHTWVTPRPSLAGLRDLVLETGAVIDTGIRYDIHRPPAELWEYHVPTPLDQTS